MATVRLTRALTTCALAASLLAPLTSSAAMGAPLAITPGEMAAIEATAPLDDPSPSDEAVREAIAIAVQKAARGAVAMGLPWVHVRAAYVRPGYVGVRVLATASAAPAPSPDDELDGRSGDSEDRRSAPRVEPDSPHSREELRL